MPKTDRFRALYVLKYLWEHTDEEHPATLAQIQNHLLEQGIATWLFYIYFHFSVIFFHVYICETYATLDTTKG